MKRLTHFSFHSLLIWGQVLPHLHPAQRPPGWLLLIITTTSSSLCFRGYPNMLKSEPLLKSDRIRPCRIWTLSCLCAPWKRHKDTNNVQIKNFPNNVQFVVINMGWLKLIWTLQGQQVCGPGVGLPRAATRSLQWLSFREETHMDWNWAHPSILFQEVFWIQSCIILLEQLCCCTTGKSAH